MEKKTYLNVRVTCLYQNNEKDLSDNQCLCGVFGKANGGFIFEEAIRNGRKPRNPRIFDGKYISMVKRRNGRYQCHIKTFDPNVVDRKVVLMQVCDELSKAFSIFD